MNHCTQLREDRTRLAIELRAVVAKAKRRKGNRGLTSAEQERFHALEAAYTATEGRIMNSTMADWHDAFPSTVRFKEMALKEQRRKVSVRENHRRHHEVFSRYLRLGKAGLEDKDKQLVALHRDLEGGSPGMPIPTMGGYPKRIRAAQTTTTTGGGYLGAASFSDMLEEALQWHGGILGVTGSFETATGTPLSWPTVNDTANQGRLLDINTVATETDLNFGQIEFGAFTFSSDYVLCPLALIEDSYFDLDEYLAQLLGGRLGRQLNKYMTVGTGTGQPTGIQTAVIAAGNTVQGATGETTSVIYDDLVNLMEAVDPAYRNLPTSGFMLADSTLKVVRKLKDTAGRPLWQPGLTAGLGQNYPETILDRPYFINNDLPAMAASAYPILFGDMKRYKVRRVSSGATVLRIAERWSDYFQVGFLAYMRADGQLVDAGTHPIAAFQNSAT